MAKNSNEIELHNNIRLFNNKQIKLLEKRYNAKYVMNCDIKDNNGRWMNVRFAIFYIAKRSEEDLKKYPNASNYVAISKLYVANGISATKPFSAIKLKSGKFLYSVTRHDFTSAEDVAIDGGREYTRIIGNIPQKIYKCQIVEDKIVVLNKTTEEKENKMIEKYSLEDFKKLLNEHIVEFSFTKADGSIRNIKGTTNPVVFGDKYDPQNTRRFNFPFTVRVFDVELNEWRSFRFANLLYTPEPKVLA